MFIAWILEMRRNNFEGWEDYFEIRNLDDQRQIVETQGKFLSLEVFAEYMCQVENKTKGTQGANGKKLEYLSTYCDQASSICSVVSVCE